MTMLARGLVLCFVLCIGSGVYADTSSNSNLQKSIYKLDKKRFEKFSNATGNVYLPSLGLSFEESAKGMLCEPQLKTVTEVLKVMDATPNEEDRKNTATIARLIARCAKGDFSAAAGVKNGDSGLKVNVTPPSPTDPASAAPGAPAKSPAVSVGKTWK